MEQQDIDKYIDQQIVNELEIEKLQEKANNLFVKKIQSAYRTKLTKDKEQMIIGDILCSMNLKENNLTKKDVYRKKINDILREKNVPHLLKNLFIFYCKFGAKSLGYDLKSTEIEFIKEINNSMFVNVSFKNTSFKGIKFNIVKFITLVDNTIFNLMYRRYKSVAKNYNINETLVLEKADLTDCEFNNCIFNNVELIELNVGASYDTTLGFKHDTTYFNNTTFNYCNFEFPLKYKKSLLPQDAINKDELITINKFKNMIYKPTVDPNGILDLKNIMYTETYTPKLVFNKTKFLQTEFKYKVRDIEHIEAIRFNECEFENYTFVEIYFLNVIFYKCNFKNGYFDTCNFKDCLFDSCNFNNNTFTNSNLCYAGATEFANCTFKNDEFKHCLLSQHKVFVYTTIFRSNCNLNSVLFSRCKLNLLKFNFDYTYSSNSNNILNMTQCRFQLCNLYGTSFDYCNLEGSNFASTHLGITKCNWFGKCLVRMQKGGANDQQLYDLGSNIKSKLEDRYLMTLFSTIQDGEDKDPDFGLYIYKYADFEGTNMDPDKLKNFEPWDYVTLEDIDDNEDKYSIIPATSFYNANIRGCNFQQIDGFQGFDFTVVKKQETTNTPDLNATNFTAVDLTNANFTNCNLIGTIFQVADIKGADFQNSITNENTDFQNTMNTALALNTQHINFGELQNRANETHARANFVIKNREKLIKFFSSYPLDDLDNSVVIYITQFDKIFTILNNSKIITDINKRYIKRNLFNFILAIATDKLYKESINIPEYNNLYSKLQECITDDFINILTTIKEPSRDDTNKQKWCWFPMVYTSILFLYIQTPIYVDTFFKYYFNEVFNAHGQGSKSCVEGMIERFITIHSQTSEYYIATLDINNPTPEIIKQIQHYDENNPDKIDSNITSEFIRLFKNQEKYKYYKLINIIKPASELPESKEEDIGIEFDYDITQKMREEHRKGIKEKINSNIIQNIQDVCDDFIKTMENIILKKAGITPAVMDNIMKNSKLKEIFLNKHAKLIKHLNDVEVPNLKKDIIFMYGVEESDIGSEELKDYFEVAGSRRKKKAKGFSRKALSLPLDKPKRFTRISPKKAKTDSLIVYKSYKNFEKKLVTNFANLSDEKIKELYKDYSTETISLKNMDITDKPYRNLIKTNFDKINDNYKIAIKNTKKYIKSPNLKSKKSSFIKIKKSKNKNTRKKTIKSKKNTTRRSKSKNKSKSKTMSKIISNLKTKNLTRKNNSNITVNKLSKTI